MARGKIRIEKLFAFIVLDPADNTEGVAAWLDPDTAHWVPMVGADMDRVRSLKPHVQRIANEANVEVRLVEFSERKELETIRPRPQG